MVLLCASAYLYWRLSREYGSRFQALQAQKLLNENEAKSLPKKVNPALKVAGVRAFTYEELADATDSFSEERQIGQGGYGKVFMGTLQDGKQVAIKAADPASCQGAHEFYTEIEFLSRIHHRNLVMLEGYCDDENYEMLVYEFMPGGNLRDHLSARSDRAPLDFPSRLRIALGAARGIRYLHTEANPPIFHRDIKASNILLDKRKGTKVADFGLSCLAPVPDLEGVTPAYVSTVVKGTPGYLDPEYYMTQKLSDKSDVYSFGVVMLELITGLQAITQGKNIVREVNKRAIEGNALTLVDPHIAKYAPEALERFMGLALRCCRETPEKRPTMVEVVSELERLGKCHVDDFSLDLSTSLENVSPPHACKPLQSSTGGGIWCETVMLVSPR